MRLPVRGGHPSPFSLGTDALVLLADEERARRVLDRRPRRGAEADGSVVRRAQLPGTQLHARRHAHRRWRALLSLLLRRARRGRPRRGVQRPLPRRDAVRPEEPLLRPEGQPRQATLAAGRREASREDSAAAAHTTAISSGMATTSRALLRRSRISESTRR